MISGAKRRGTVEAVHRHDEGHVLRLEEVDRGEAVGRAAGCRRARPRRDAPADSSCHMNQNRSWPGVPNRYSTTSGDGDPAEVKGHRRGGLTRNPVEVVGGGPDADSRSSVRSGLISLTELTRVVLPTPKPPAISSLTAIGTICFALSR